MVNAPLPVSAANVAGGAVGQGQIALGQSISNLAQNLNQIAEMGRDSQDKIAQSKVNNKAREFDQLFESQKSSVYPEGHARAGQKVDLIEARKELNQQLLAFNEQQEWGHPNSKRLATETIKGIGDVNLRSAQVDVAKQQHKEALVVLENDLVSAYASGDQDAISRIEDILRDELTKDYQDSKTIDVVIDKIKAKGTAARAEIAVDNVYAAIEAASDPKVGAGDFEIAREMAKSDLIDEKTQSTLRNAIKVAETEWNRADAIKTNQSVKGDIEAKAYDIQSERVTPKEYRIILDEARYGKVIDGEVKYTFGEMVSNVPLIDDTAYDELRTLGTTGHKASQDTGMSEASKWGKGQLVEVTSELDFQEILASLSGADKRDLQSKHQLQLDNWAQFNRSMRVWQSKNPDAGESEIYIESRRKLPFYRTRSDDEVASGAPIIETVGDLIKDIEKKHPELVDKDKKSPFKEYPDAFKVGGNWYIMQGGNRYRIEK